MRDVKAKSSTKIMKGKSKKSRAKNYIQENVQKLKQLQHERPKIEKERNDQDREMSYAKRLKTVTSPHIKMVQKLSLLKQQKLRKIKSEKKISVEPNSTKIRTSQINRTSVNPSISLSSDVKIRKLTKSVVARDEIRVKKEKELNRPIMFEMVSSHETNKETDMGRKLEAKISSNVEVIKDGKVVRKLRHDKKETDGLKDNYSELEHPNTYDNCNKDQNVKCFSESKLINIPKGFKNEGCQAKSNKSQESIDSKAIIRFPRTINTVTKRMKKNFLEKSLQTEMINSTPAPLILKNNTRTFSKLPTSDKSIISQNEKKDLSFQSNNRQSLLATNMIKNGVRSTVVSVNKYRNTINKIKTKCNPRDEKANRILNDLISASNVDIRELYNEITRVQTTSPFARHHTVFENRSPEELRKERDLCMNNNPNRSEGTIVLPDHKRREYLAQIKKKHSELLQQLNSMPVNSKSLEARQKKIKLGKDIDTMDNAIKLFSKHLLIDLNKSL